MIQMTMHLDANQQRPVVKLGSNLSALLDTGAFIPVWVDDESILVDLLGAEFIEPNVPVSGFGGTTYGNHYKVTLQVGKLIYPNMSIIASSDISGPFQLILSATMFSGLIYEIDDKRHELNINIPDGESTVRNLKVENSKGKVNILCSSGD